MTPSFSTFPSNCDPPVKPGRDTVGRRAPLNLTVPLGREGHVFNSDSPRNPTGRMPRALTLLASPRELSARLQFSAIPSGGGIDLPAAYKADVRSGQGRSRVKRRQRKLRSRPRRARQASATGTVPRARLGCGWKSDTLGRAEGAGGIPALNPFDEARPSLDVFPDLCDEALHDAADCLHDDPDHRHGVAQCPRVRIADFSPHVTRERLFA